jgi:hypothetical protein
MITLEWLFDKKRMFNPHSPSEEIVIGMSLADFNKDHYSRINAVGYINEPKWFCYKYFDCIHFHFNAEVGMLENVYIDSPYKGKYRNSIGIGSKVEELLKIESNIQYDDDYIIIGNDGLGFGCNEDFDGIDESEFGNCLIERIILF